MDLVGSKSDRIKKTRAIAQLAKAGSTEALAVAALLANAITVNNAAPIIAAQVAIFDSSAAFPPGMYLVIGRMSFGPTDAAGIAVTGKLRQDGVALATPLDTTSSGGADKNGSTMIAAILTIAAGPNQTFGIQADAGGGHTAQVTAAGGATLVVVPLA